MTKQSAERWGLGSRLAVLCLPAAAALVFPSAVMAASAGGSTVRAIVGGDGSVKSVKIIGVDGSSGAFNGTLPLKLSIGRTVAGNNSTYTYEVQNTFSKTQEVTYSDTAGKTHTTTTTLQLPLVAQLGVEVPKSFKNVTAPNGVVTTDPDGTSRVLYNLVLFNPLGSPTQTVSFTATGTGAPTAELAAAAVNPSTTAGLSAASQDATANSQQDDFWTGFAGGGNAGLTKLVAGMDQLVGGLSQLRSGLVTAADGAKQLDAGTTAADQGAHKLAPGLGEIHAGLAELTGGIAKIAGGQGSLAGGLGQIYTGQQELTGGISKIHDGQSSLTGGLTTIHGGQQQLTGGLTQISGGLDQLANAQAGLPAAAAGIQQAVAGVTAMLAGVGDDATAGTLINGVELLIGGLNQLHAGLEQSAGCAADVLGKVLSGFPGGADPCAQPGGVLPPMPPLSVADPTAALVLPGLITQFSAVANNTDPNLAAAFGGLGQGLQKIHDGLTHAPGAAGPTDPGGLAEGLAALKTGLTALSTGVGTASGGITALAAGAHTALSGSQQLTAGTASALTGSQELTAGSADALAGSKKLTVGTGSALAGAKELATGSGSALVGSKKLTAGAGDAATGANELSAGLDKLAAGQHEVAAGMPAAVSGVSQLLTGGQQVKDGIGAVQSQAIGPLTTQLSTGSLNAKKQLAILSAAAGLASEAPGGAGASYVLTQSTNGFRLAANSSAAPDHTARNVGIGLGGAAALVVAVVAGFALGRRSRVAA